MTSAFATLLRKGKTAIGLAKNDPKIMLRLILLNMQFVAAPIRSRGVRLLAASGLRRAKELNYRDLIVLSLQKDIRDIRRSLTAQ